MQEQSKKFLSTSQLRERWGKCSHMFIERRLRDDPRFPRPVKLGESVGTHRLWALDEIEAYERACTYATKQQAKSE